MSNLRSLEDQREKARAEHRERCRKLFEDHPEIFEDAIIMSHDAGIILTPEWMDNIEIVGRIEAAKFSICLQATAHDLDVPDR